MSTLVVCTDCQRKLKVREESLGKSVVCPSCQSRFVARADEDSSDTSPPKQQGVVRAEGAGRGSGRPSRAEDAEPIRDGKAPPPRKNKPARRTRDENDAPRSNKGLLIGLIAGGALLLIGLVCGGAALFFMLVVRDKSANSVASIQADPAPGPLVPQPQAINPRPNNPVPPRRAPVPSSFIIAHGLPVKHMVLNPDGTVIASADQHRLKLWVPFVKNHKPLADFAFLRNAVSALAFAPDGKQLAVAHDTTAIELCDGRTGSPLPTPPIRLTRGADPKDVVVPGSRRTHCLAFSPNGKVVAVGMEGDVYLWDIKAGKQLRLFKAHADAVQAMVYSSDGKTLATAGRDNLVKLWDADTGAERFVLRGHTKGVQALSFTADGTRLASAGADAVVILWDVAAGAEKGRLTGCTGAVLRVAYSPDGKLLATGSADSTLRLWDAQTFAERWQIHHGGNFSAVEAVAFHPNGNTFFATYAGMIQLWDVPKLLGP